MNMFSTSQIVNVTKSAIAQMVADGYMDGDGELTALDSQYIVDLGEKLDVENGNINTNSPADIFFKALMSQIGKIIIDTRSYVAELPRLYVDTVNWGLFTEQVMIDLSDVMIDEMWNADGFINWNTPAGTNPVTLSGQEEGSRIASIEFGCYKPPVTAKLYSKVHAIMVALTIAREQMFTAFRGIDEYSSFIAGLFNSVENTIQVKAEVYALMAVSMGIAKAKANGNEINLLTEYNTKYSTTLTASKAFNDENFMRFALMRIAETKYNIRRYTALYNNHNHVTFASEPNTILLNSFANSAKFGVRANTFNEQLLGIGDYDSVSAWQSAVTSTNSTPYAFENASTIMLSSAGAEYAGLGTATGAGTITGVIGVIYDRLAMGVTVDKRKTTSQYSASRDTTNYFYHSLISYVVNDSYPIVSFVVRDVTTPTPTT